MFYEKTERTLAVNIYSPFEVARIVTGLPKHILETGRSTLHKEENIANFAYYIKVTMINSSHIYLRDPLSITV